MNTLKIEAKLAEKYKYKPLPGDLSEKYRGYFIEHTPPFLSLEGGSALYTLKGSLICNSYDRIVVGDYGAFIEFSESEANLKGFGVKRGQEYRINNPKFWGKYEWYTVADGSDVKLYKQLGTVSYADYRVGLWYVSVHEVSV